MQKNCKDVESIKSRLTHETLQLLSDLKREVAKTRFAHMCLLLPYQLSSDMKIVLTAAFSAEQLGKTDKIQSLRCKTKRETNRPQPVSAQPTSHSIDEPAKSSK